MNAQLFFSTPRALTATLALVALAVALLISVARAADENPSEVVLPAGAGEAITLPGPVNRWKQLDGPPVIPAELDGTTTWRLFEPGLYRFGIADGATPVSAIRGGAWRVFPGKTPQLGNRRPEIALPATLDAQAGHPVILAALSPRDNDGDALTYLFRVINTNPPQPSGILATREDSPRCVLDAPLPGAFDLECRAFDGKILSRPALTRVTVVSPARKASPFQAPLDFRCDRQPFHDAMEQLAKTSSATIAFQGAGALKDRPLTLAARALPLYRILDLAAWQTGASYRLEILPGQDAPDRTVILWIDGWDELRRETLAAGELSLADFAQTPAGADIEPQVADIIREALAAQPLARINLHGQFASLGCAVYLPRSAHDRLARALTALNKPSAPQPSLVLAAEEKARALQLQFTTVTLPAQPRSLTATLQAIEAQLHCSLLINPPEAADWLAAAKAAAAADSPGETAATNPAATPQDEPLLTFSAIDLPGDEALRQVCACIDRLRGPVAQRQNPVQARPWAPGCYLLSAESPLPEPSADSPGPGQWLWQSATVQAYDLAPILAATGGTGEAIEHRIRTRFAREFRDPAAHLSWWPRKKALLVIQRPALQDAVANLLVAIQQEDRSPLHSN